LAIQLRDAGGVSREIVTRQPLTLSSGGSYGEAEQSTANLRALARSTEPFRLSPLRMFRSGPHQILLVSWNSPTQD
jgi:hypothetical protein